MPINGKQEERAVRAVVSKLNAIAQKHGVETTRRGVNRWNNAMRAKASLERRRVVLEKELAAVSRKLR